MLTIIAKKYTKLLVLIVILIMFRVAPLQLLNVIVVLYFHAELGYASLAGLILIFIFVPFQGQNLSWCIRNWFNAQ